MKDGYPDRVCNYCQLQLNTFHAFVKKAKSSSHQFAKILEGTKSTDHTNDIDSLHSNDSVHIIQMHSSTNDKDEIEASTSRSSELEFVIEKDRVDIVGAGYDGLFIKIHLFIIKLFI